MPGDVPEMLSFSLETSEETSIRLRGHRSRLIMAYIVRKQITSVLLPEASLVTLTAADFHMRKTFTSPRLPHTIGLYLPPVKSVLVLSWLHRRSPKQLNLCIYVWKTSMPGLCASTSLCSTPASRKLLYLSDIDLE